MMKEVKMKILFCNSTPSTDKTKTLSKLEQQKSVRKNGKGGVPIFTKLYSSSYVNQLQYAIHVHCICVVTSNHIALQFTDKRRRKQYNTYTIHTQYKTQYNKCTYKKKKMAEKQISNIK